MQNKIKFPAKLTKAGLKIDNFVDLLPDTLYEYRSIKPNQRVYGKSPERGNWGMLVTYKEGKFISSHFYDHLNNKEWIEYNE